VKSNTGIQLPGDSDKMRTVLCLLLLVPLTIRLAAASEQRPPNIVLLFVDDMGYADMGTQGAAEYRFRTPRLDQLAAEGTRFTNFLVAQPVCTASRAALMSGCYSNRVGMAGALNHTSRTGIHLNELLIPELLKEQGYVTACYGKWHLGTLKELFPTRHGFDEWFGIPYSNDNGPLHPTVPGMPPLPLYDNDMVVELDPDQALFTRRFTARATQFIEAHKDEPFFLYVPHVMPHVPIFASDKFRGTSDGGLWGDVMEELDAGIGEVLDCLKKNQLEQNTLVIFASDNGPYASYGDHAGHAKPLRGGKLTCFEGGVRVPCLMRWPGQIPAGRVSDALLSSIDLLPTIAGIAGARLPERPIDGIDVWPVISGQSEQSPRQTFNYYSGQQLHAVRYQNWKLHFPHEYLVVAAEPGKNGKPSNWENMKPLSITESGIRGIASRHGYRVESMGMELYDLSTDISESRNVAAEHPSIVRRLQELAESVRIDLGDSLHGVVGQNVRPRIEL
jgi:arylsulfatase A-like enzyme